ncbi:MAG TPA: glutathione S-transferase family protein [Usitatibacteraceae bacterium]|nr:glutathione S-transferase family protein [Usitatibacteraceae bacterium]
MSLTLVIANRNYSSWSMRPWVLLSQLNIPFREVLIKFHSSEWVEQLPRLSPSRLVPVLWDGTPGAPDALAIWDSLAIAEYLAERHPEAGVWPAQARARARARSISAEMHAGFRALRNAMPMNIRSQHPGKGHTPEALRDVARIESLWRETRAEFGATGPFLFGRFSAADAMYAPVVMRFATYHPPLSDESRAYCAAIQEAGAVSQWAAAARLEREFVPEDEPYAAAPAA